MDIKKHVASTKKYFFLNIIFLKLKLNIRKINTKRIKSRKLIEEKTRKYCLNKYQTLLP